MLSTLVYVSSYPSEKPMTSNSRERVPRLQAEQRQAARSQLLLHVRPGREDALRQHVRLLIEDVVEDGEPEVRHADVVDVGVGEGQAQRRGVPVLDDGVPLAAGIAGGPCHFAQDGIDVQHVGAAFDIR